MKCEFCDTDHEVVYVHSRCHVFAPMWPVLYEDIGVLALECSVCKIRVGEWTIDRIDTGTHS